MSTIILVKLKPLPVINENTNTVNNEDRAPMISPFISPLLSRTQNIQPKKTDNTFINWFTAFITPPLSDAIFNIPAKINTATSVVISAVNPPFNTLGINFVEL